jgi:hypothetical protein
MTRYTLAGILAMGLVLIPLGCESGGGVGPIHRGGDGPTLPDSTIADLRVCAEHAAGHLKESTYTFMFRVDVTEGGNTGRVRLSDSYPGDADIASCMEHALRAMTVPPSVDRMLTKQTEVSPDSRGLIGNPLAIAIELGPIVLVAAGVTVLVAVTATVSQEIIDAARRRRRARIQCMKACEAEAEVCEEDCRKSTKEGTEERRLCWTACIFKEASCKRKC